MNCTRCAACSLLPETDMSQPRPLILCGKLGHPKELNLHGCGATQGDVPKQHATPVEEAFVRAHYPTDVHGMVSRVTGRSLDTLRQLAARIGVHCGPGIRLARSAQARRRNKMASGKSLNPAQALALQKAQAEGRYPVCGGPTQGVAGRAQAERNRALRSDLLIELRKLGPVERWEVIPIYVGNNSPAQKRRTALRQAMRKAPSTAAS